MKLLSSFVLLVLIAPLGSSFASAQSPINVLTGEYKLAPKVHEDVVDDRETELWGKVYYPVTKVSRKNPLIVMLHGNHATCGRGENPRIDDNCQYTNTGTCPDGYEVVPNHLGYDYLGQELAGLGFLVVSINANLGITCGSGSGADWGMNSARGKLILKHIELLSQWSENGESKQHLPFNLAGQIDFNEIGLFGHSRGGEGARAAYHFHKEDQWQAKVNGGFAIKSIFEVAPTDGLASLQLDSYDIHWNVLIGACDGDVRNYAGVKPFDRMISSPVETNGTSKSVFYVWGANHNFFNTEWQVSDSYSCNNHEPLWADGDTGSVKQRQSASLSVIPFFKGTLGKDKKPSELALFSPRGSLEQFKDVTRVDRMYSVSVSPKDLLLLQNFSQELGDSFVGPMPLMTDVEVHYNESMGSYHDYNRKSANISWEQSAANPSYTVLLGSEEVNSLDLSSYKYLSFDLSREVYSDLNSDDVTDFTITFTDLAGNEASVKLSELGMLTEPGSRKILSKTFSVSIDKLASLDLKSVHSMTFKFDVSKSGSIYLSFLRASGGDNHPKGEVTVTTGKDGINSSLLKDKFNVFRNATPKLARTRIPNLRVKSKDVLLTLKSNMPFMPGAQVPTLKIGSFKSMAVSRPHDGSLSKLYFKVPKNILKKAKSSGTKYFEVLMGDEVRYKVKVAQ